MLALSPEGRAPREVRLKAGRNGDSVAAVAKRYRVSAAHVAQWNGVSPQARFKAGQTILVMLAPAPARTAKAGQTTRKVAKAAPARKKATKLRVAQR
jgi:membrane-bound lytic murein transglycosylase D